MKKINLIFIITGIFILIIISNISALGITPGRTTIDFSPNFEKEIKFSVINSEKKDMNIAFAIHGEPENIVSLDNEIVHFNSNEYSKDFRYKIKLPSDLPPGLHKIEIVVIELPEEIDNEEIIVRTTLSVATQLYVYSPYPGKYLDSEMNIVGNEGLILFYVPLINRGEEDINEVKGKIEIYQENKKITEIETNKISISSGERKELLGSFDSLNIPPGRYKAKIIIDYDGNQLEIEKEFEIGEEFIKILGVSADEFALGEVARIKILVQNKQQTKINKIYAGMNIYDDKITRVADLKSQDYEILELSNKEIIVYWDTKEIEEGKYTSELKTNYDEKVLAKNLKMDVSKNSIIFSGVGFAISNNNKNFNAKNFLIIIIGILVLANVLWFLWWLSKKKDGN